MPWYRSQPSNVSRSSSLVKRCTTFSAINIIFTYWWDKKQSTRISDTIENPSGVASFDLRQMEPGVVRGEVKVVGRR